MDEYLTTIELSQRIKMAPGTIRNLVWKNDLVEGVHYLKPTPRKLLFVWSAIEAWLHGLAVAENQPIGHAKNPRCLINI